MKHSTNPSQSEKRYNVPELSEVTGMSMAFWRKEIFHGRIDVERYGRSVRISQGALDAYRAKQARRGGEAA